METNFSEEVQEQVNITLTFFEQYINTILRKIFM